MSELLLDGDDLREMVLRLAHEVKNPLATILSAAQLMAMGPLSEGEMEEYLRDIILGVRRIDGAIRDLRRYVQLQVRAGSRTPVRRLVHRSLQRLGNRREGVVVVPSAPQATVLADEDRLVDALVELIENALRHSPPGRPVTVGWEVGPDGKLLLWVQDEGPGVPDDIADRLFKPFFSTSTTGTGLGLTLANRIVIAHGGQVLWRNLGSGGCRFTISLPVAEDRGTHDTDHS